MEGARRVFLQDGFDGASIGDIVRAAGVSKGTLYAYFPSKEHLFKALITEDRRKQAEVLFTLDETDRDVARVLRQLGTTFLDMLLHPEPWTSFASWSALRPNFRRSAKPSSMPAPAFGMNRLASYLRRLTGRASFGRGPSARRATISRSMQDRHPSPHDARKPDRPVQAEVIDRNVDSAIKVFLAAYGAPLSDAQ